MKKLITMVLALTLAFTMFTACNNTGNGTSTGNGNQETVSTPDGTSQNGDGNVDETMYTATFTVDGNVYDTFEGPRNAVVEAPADPVKEGYTFIGWSGFSEGYKLRSNKTFVAQFIKEMSGLPTATTFQTPTVYNLTGDNYAVNVYEAKKTTATIEIDGVIDDAYLDATPIEIAARADGTADATGFAYIVWDSNYIYVYVSVTDSNPMPYDSGDVWLSDSVEFVIDTWNKSTTQGQNYGDSYRGGDYQGEGQFRVNAGGSSVTGMHWMYDDAGVERKGASRIVDGEGYTAEFKIAWASFKNSVAAGKQIAFAILINNGANGNRTGVTGVEAGQINAFQWAGVLSKLNLID